ncbi:MAG: enolase C-terminal domain-like protein [Rubrivivax sp.]|nr:enolase C-terminal domain-like protein [Rubrivivax sp.]
MTNRAAPLRLILQTPRRVAVGDLVVRGVRRERQAVRIRVHDAQGTVGLGEALPLPGYSRDEAATAERVLSALAQQLSGTGLVLPAAPAGVAQIDAALAPHAHALAAAPSARFALECALLDLLARRDGVSAAAWLARGRALQAVPVSVLLPEDMPGAIIATTAAVARGHGVLKLKIARADRTLRDEDALLGAVRAAADAARTGTGPPVLLRLDANGAMDRAQLPARMAALVHHGIELVEEPVAGAALLQMPALPLPWAADESLVDAGLAAALLELPAGRRPCAWVLKPAELGLSRCLDMAATAAEQGLGVIVTHSLDGELGHAAACALAAALPLPPWPCGLAPHAGLRHAAPAQPLLPVPTAPGLGVAEAGDHGR